MRDADAACVCRRSKGHPARPHDRGAGRAPARSWPAYDFVPDQIQPASLDLRLGEVAYRVRASFLPGPSTTVAERIDELKLHEIALGNGAVLGNRLRLHRAADRKPGAAATSIAAAANPKSSTGRLDVFTRVIADETRGFDQHQRRLPWSALCRDQPAHFPDPGARGHAAVADPLPARQCACSTPKRCEPCMRANGW